MGMGIDEAGSDEEPLGIEFPSASGYIVADLGDAVPADGDVGATQWPPAAVGHGAIANDQVSGHGDDSSAQPPNAHRRRGLRASTNCSYWASERVTPAAA